MSISQQQEKRVARLLKGKRQPGSGSGFYNKGDVISEEFLVECKATEKKSFRLTTEVVEKITGEAMAKGKMPVLVVTLRAGSTSEMPLVLMRMEHWKNRVL